jgi:phospholipid N-methyltransferase
MPVLTFMKEAVGSFRELGAFLPTQPLLAHKIARNLPHRPGIRIVELGAGEGSITRAIVEELAATDYELLVIESRTNLLTANEKSIRDRAGSGVHRRCASRISFLLEDAFSLGRILDQRGISWVDAIVSSLPLFHFAPAQRRDLFALAQDRLNRTGVFIQYRYTPQGLDELRPFFDRVHRSFVPNVLPAWLFVCRTPVSWPRS